MVARSKAGSATARLLGFVGSNSAERMAVYLFVSVVCCQVEVCCECCVLSGRGLL